ncbi:hypothetical protein Acr_09g0001620 [Actinidia rufa]|uniref:Uncharacterized protein n=1 Tax=Actinidia rufa TaxID=165716 RepID=A0A7J0F5N3_9ERIC|nr:hypothetical protein Acr_09g0001620 [Actinidia rufa]
MGNCQTAEAATVIIQHPGDKVERIYGSVSAHEVMYSNPGHYVALVFTSPAEDSDNGVAAKRLKLLRPGDTLLMGQVYRLISFEDVLKVFAEKKSVKLAKLLERGGFSMDKTKPSGGETFRSENRERRENQQKRKRGNEVEEDVNEAAKGIEFGKVKLGGEEERERRKKKRKTSKKNEELEGVKKLQEVKKDPEVGKKHSWKAAVSRAAGVKVHDDPRLLKQSAQKERRHEKSAEKWK